MNESKPGLQVIHDHCISASAGLRPGLGRRLVGSAGDRSPGRSVAQGVATAADRSDFHGHGARRPGPGTPGVSAAAGGAAFPSTRSPSLPLGSVSSARPSPGIGQVSILCKYRHTAPSALAARRGPQARLRAPARRRRMRRRAQKFGTCHKCPSCW